MPLPMGVGPVQALEAQMSEAVESRGRPVAVDQTHREDQFIPIDAGLLRYHRGTVGCLRDRPCLFTDLGMVLRLAELMGGMINDGIGMVRAGRAVDSRTMSIHTFRAMEPLMIGEETKVTTTGVTTGEKPRADGAEALATKIWAEAEPWSLLRSHFYIWKG